LVASPKSLPEYRFLGHSSRSRALGRDAPGPLGARGPTVRARPPRRSARGDRRRPLTSAEVHDATLNREDQSSCGFATPAERRAPVEEGRPVAIQISSALWKVESVGPCVDGVAGFVGPVGGVE
jgi:hypothetical protein